MENYDAHARPPESMRNLFKDWRRGNSTTSEISGNLIDPFAPDQSEVTYVDGVNLVAHSEGRTSRAFKINALPGLYVLPSILDPGTQIALLDKLLHRDLSQPFNKTNVHLHHHVSYPESSDAVQTPHHIRDPSFFAADSSTVMYPKDPEVHKPITYAQMLETKLRWLTLGAQYDWTNKKYPDEEPPSFPADISAMLKSFFPDTEAEAAIVNFYNHGDTLSLHRDVSETSDKGLISISLGCDGIFLVGNEHGTEAAAIRLRSGDAILMSGESRYAWHGVPKILPETCPTWLRDWPNISDKEAYAPWRGWMSSKRINLNVRQVR